MKAIRSIYGLDPVPTPSPDVEIGVDAPVAEEVAFTLVTNQKYKDKSKVLSPLSKSSLDSRSKTSLVLRAPSLPKAITTCSATMTSKTVQA